MQYTVKKPINNNILRVVDSTGCELIVTGRGLGFGVKPGYKIEAETVERSYRMTSPAVQQKLVELLEQIPYEHLLLTDELVAMIRSRVNYPLNESLLITLADHISFAIQRSEQGIRFSNPLMAPIREFYPEEYRLGMGSALPPSASAAMQTFRTTRVASLRCTSSTQSSTPP